MLKLTRKKIALLIAMLTFAMAIGMYTAYTFYFEKTNVTTGLVGTYTEQTSDGQNQTMELRADGTLYIQASANNTYGSGTWKMIDDKTIEASMQVQGTTIVEKFNIFGIDLVSKQNHNLWLKK
jgi:hypothetical protein